MIPEHLVRVGISTSEDGPHLLSSAQLTAGPFEWLLLSQTRAGHYPDYVSTMSQSDYRISPAPPCFFSL